MITVKRILDVQFPEKNGVWSDEDFAQVEVVSLTGLNIREIDNLDLFDNISELNLQQNSITKIENVGHLMKLRHLDLSDNAIDSEGLNAERLPPNLKTLNLAGNPCVSCNQTMHKFKEVYPNISLTCEANKESRQSPDTTGPNPATSVVSSDGETYLDSESVLRAVVDRKCRLQALAPVDISSTLQSLEKEYDGVIIASRNRKNCPEVLESGIEHSVVDVTMEHVPHFQARLGELQALTSKANADTAGDDFFKKLRERSLQVYDEKIKENKINAEIIKN